jgi:hypothetical protein
MAAALLALRSLLWTFLLPGVVAGYVPWRYFGLSTARIAWSDPLGLIGLALSAGGTLLLAACIVEFARSGRGTLSPVDPPRHLVVRGLYRYVRNPMYLAVTLILLGEAALRTTHTPGRSAAGCPRAGRRRDELTCSQRPYGDDRISGQPGDYMARITVRYCAY